MGSSPTIATKRAISGLFTVSCTLGYEDASVVVEKHLSGELKGTDSPGIVKAKNYHNRLGLVNLSSGGSFHFLKWVVGLHGVATCLADKTTDGFDSHTIHHCGVDKRLSRQPHKLEIVGSSPTLRNQPSTKEDSRYLFIIGRLDARSFIQLPLGKRLFACEAHVDEQRTHIP